jgi:hypothetical protein
VELFPHQRQALAWLLWRESQHPPGIHIPMRIRIQLFISMRFQIQGAKPMRIRILFPKIIIIGNAQNIGKYDTHDSNEK